MKKMRTFKVAASVAAAGAVAGGGAALAASDGWSPAGETNAVLEEAAEELGVEPARLREALRNALESRLEAAVADGRLDAERAQALEERLRAGELPLFGVPGHGHGLRLHGPHRILDEAASFLGLEEGELRDRLAAGETLAEIARDQGKAVDALVDALVADGQKRLEEAVASGRLTRAQADQLAAGLSEHVESLVRGEHVGPRLRFEEGAPFGGPHGHRGPPPWTDGPHA
ncbi:MAG TPA: hypothetical protein VNJ53_01195 [Gaiellaceae bacterium]|nr:hypothetical protein [Gaiellaceae bacterium]